MSDLEPDLSNIASRALSLSEVLAENARPSISGDVRGAPCELLERWCNIVADGNWKTFEERLRWSSLDFTRTNATLGEHNPVAPVAIPSWISTLRQIIAAVKRHHESPSCLGAGTHSASVEILPFVDVWRPLLHVARAELELRAGRLDQSLISPSAYADLEKCLLRRLTDASSRVLYYEFCRFRPFGLNLLATIAEASRSCTSKSHYQAFVSHLTSTGLLGLFKDYPALARLIARTVEMWVDGVVAFSTHLQTDVAAIEAAFGINGAARRVTSISADLSDHHRGARTVWAVQFNCGTKLVYKPRSLGIEESYNQIVQWCNHRDVSLCLRVLRVLDRDDHGWVEFVEASDCQDEHASERYYCRAGMLLAILHVLGATDCHYENIIAAGEDPVVIDVETLINHELSWLSDSPAEREALNPYYRQVWDSVLRTGLLPRWEVGTDGTTTFDLSGLGGGKDTPQPTVQWRRVNTDEMSVRSEERAPADGGVASRRPADHIESLVDGFCQIYDILSNSSEHLLCEDGPLSSLKSQRSRFVFRSTSTYARILERSLTPDALRSGIARSIEIDALSRAFLFADEKPRDWPILQAEIYALEQLDIPYFEVSTDTADLVATPGGRVAGYFQQPSYDGVRARLSSLSPADRRQQVEIIRGAFLSKVVRLGSQGRDHPSPSDPTDAPSMTREEFLELAERIGSQICERRISLVDGGVTWMGLDYIMNSGRFQYQPVNVSLYEGVCGIALFLVALGQITGKREFTDVAVQGLLPFRRFVRSLEASGEQRHRGAIGIGGVIGLGSVIYSLAKIQTMAPEVDLVREASCLAGLISPAMIDGDREFDVMSGAAGLILGLLALHQVTGESSLLEQASRCGHRLVAVSDEETCAWVTRHDKRPMTGFSHGASGISYSLLRLYQCTGDLIVHRAALGGLAYERRVFDRALPGWPDVRPGEARDPNGLGRGGGWCNGATGIGLARLSSLAVLDTPEVRADIEFVLGAVLEGGLTREDHICCGNFGRVDFLSVACEKLGRPPLRADAERMATAIINQSKQRGGFRFFSNLETGFTTPGFFRGLAGVGYTLLRLARPGTLPSITSLE